MTSLSGQFTTFSKLVIYAMMIRGRHRGLPNALDRAIMLPNEHNDCAEADRDESQAKNLMGDHAPIPSSETDQRH
jgi:Trk-type K+ transport system membrane component